MRLNSGSLAVAFTLARGISAGFSSHDHTYDFHITHIERDGVTRTVANGLYPGPLIRVPYNSTVAVNVYDDLPDNATAIHWHGIHQHETPSSDGVPTQNQCPISPGKVMQYEWRADPPGSTFWHNHFHAMTVDGLHGGLVVEDQPGTFPYHYDEEVVILLGDEYNRTSWVIENYLTTPDPNGIVRIDPFANNGLMCVYDESVTPATPSCSNGPTGSGFTLNFEPGKVYRLRLVCVSLVEPYVFQIDGHQMQVVTADLSILDGSAVVDGLPIWTGQRYDVLVTAKSDAKPDDSYWVRATGQPQCGPPTNDTLVTDIRGVLTYGPKTTGSVPTPQSTNWNVTNPNCTDVDYTLLKQYPPFLTEPYSVTVQEPSMTVSLNVTFPVPVGTEQRTNINGQFYTVTDTSYPTLFAIQQNPSWTPPATEQRNIITVSDSYLGQNIRVILTATGFGTHPFHLHGHLFRRVASGLGAFDATAQAQVNAVKAADTVVRDTGVLESGGWLVIDFTVNNPGVWALHCHNGWHLESGMLVQFVEMPTAISTTIDIPQAHKDLCPPQ